VRIVILRRCGKHLSTRIITLKDQGMFGHIKLV
jgi:hypothetical protein